MPITYHDPFTGQVIGTLGEDMPVIGGIPSPFRRTGVPSLTSASFGTGTQTFQYGARNNFLDAAGFPTGTPKVLGMAV